MAGEITFWINRKSIFLFFVIFCLPLSKGALTYTVVAPKSIQPHSAIRVVLFISKCSHMTRFSASIVNNGTIVYTSDLIVTKEVHPPRVLTIATEDLPEIQYNLVFNAISGDGKNYTDKTLVFSVTKQRSILIQTDKTVYKPGDTVRIRVLILNRYLIPMAVSPTADILVYDAEKHLIKSWVNVTILKGMFSNRVILANHTILGDWKVNVISSERKESQIFTVMKHVAPKFNIELKLPPFLTFNASSFVVQAKASYFGKQIIGKCVFSLKQYYPYDTKSQPKERTIVKTVPIKGVAHANFDIGKEFGIKEGNDKEFQVTAQVTEELGGKIQTVSQIIALYKYAYKMEMLTETEAYTPGFPLTVTIKVTTQDGLPIKDSNPQALKVTHGFSYYAEGSVLYSPIPANGLVNFTFQTPTNEHLTVSNIDATYKDVTQWFPPPKKAPSSSGIYLHISMVTEHPTAGSDLEFMTESGQMFSHIMYLLVSRGRILLFDEILFKAPRNRTTIKISVPTTATPTAHLLVGSLFEPKQALVVNSLKFSIAPKIENFLNVTFSENIKEPGANVTLNIETSPSSMVALRAVDQSVLTLKDDVGITLGRLQSELLSYEEEILRTKGWNVPADEIFDDAGLIIMTNSKIVRTRLSAVQFMLSEAPMALARLAIASLKNLESGRNLISQVGNSLVEQTRLSRKPPETWFWEEIFTPTGNASLTVRVPETLTSWIITGYSLTDNKPIGLPQRSIEFKSYRPFLLSANLPRCVIEGEVLSLQILVHNFMDKNIAAEIIMDNSDQKYDFFDSENLQKIAKIIKVNAGTVSTLQFLVQYNKIGVTEMKIIAIIPGIAGDCLTKLITVKPNGVLRKKSTSYFVSVNPSTMSSLEKDLTAEFPQYRHPGLDTIEVIVIGDLMQLAMTNINHLVKRGATGAENLLAFIFDTTMLVYLNTTGTLTPGAGKKFSAFLETTYQNELAFRRYDGSFSTFGNEDVIGSTWITAYAIEAFINAKSFITIDTDLIRESLTFLLQMQKENGSFIELGNVIFSDSAIMNDAYLTASVARVLILSMDGDFLDETLKNDLEIAIKKSLEYISEINISEYTAHTINLIAYCLDIANHEKKDLFFKKMESLQSNCDDGMYWKLRMDSDAEKSQSKATKPYRSKPHEVAASSYALLTYLRRNMNEKAMSVFKWIVRQLNHFGGFLTDQDTFMGLKVLSKMGTILKNDNPSVSISINYNDSQREEFQIKQDNVRTLQSKKLPISVPSVSLNASGNGSALVQIVSSYYILEELQDPNFLLTTTVTDIDQGKIMGLLVCGRYIGSTESNMIIIEVKLPTGYTFTSYDLKELTLKGPSKLLHHDSEVSQNNLMMFFRFLKHEESVCVSLHVNTEYHVIKQAPGRVIMYDYYDSSKKSIQMFKPPVVDVCKVCKSEYMCKADDCVNNNTTQIIRVKQ